MFFVSVYVVRPSRQFITVTCFCVVMFAVGKLVGTLFNKKDVFTLKGVYREAIFLEPKRSCRASSFYGELWGLGSPTTDQSLWLKLSGSLYIGT